MPFNRENYWDFLLKNRKSRRLGFVAIAGQKPWVRQSGGFGISLYVFHNRLHPHLKYFSLELL
jgi:hypothetical protein